MIMLTSLLSHRISVSSLIRSWTISFLGNLIGMLLFTLLLIGHGGALSKPAFRTQTMQFAMEKAVDPMWHQIFLKGIGANWLVCLAVFLGMQAREVGSKILAIWFPCATFVALELDHVVADMFYIMIAMFNGAEISVWYYVWKSMLPTLLGNIVGGGLFVGGLYWYLYLEDEEQVEVPATGALQI